MLADFVVVFSEQNLHQTSNLGYDNNLYRFIIVIAKQFHGSRSIHYDLALFFGESSESDVSNGHSLNPPFRIHDGDHLQIVLIKKAAERFLIQCFWSRDHVSAHDVWTILSPDAVSKSLKVTIPNNRSSESVT